MKTLLKLSKLISSLFPVMILSILFGTAGHLCAISIPVLGSLALVEKFSVWFLILIGIARGILHYIEQYCNHFIAFSILAKIRTKVFAKLRELGPAKLEGKEKGNLISLITSDIELLEVFYAHTVSPVFIALFTGICMILFFWHFNWILAVLALAFYLIVAAGVPAIVNRKAVQHGTEYRAQFASMNSFMLDCLRGISQSILYGNGNKKLESIKSKSDNLAQSRKKMAVNEGFTAAISGTFVILASLCMLLVSMLLYKNGTVEFGDVVICTTAMFSSFGPSLAVAALGSSLSGTIASGNRLLALLDEKPVTKTVSNGTNTDFSGAEGKNICFKYPSVNGKSESENILQDVNIQFPKGKIIGIQGKSGSGKSTLLKLFMHFWEADSGSVNISEIPIEKINTACLRKIESYVTQETVLFHDTIENNLRIAKLDATLEEIQEACKKAELHDFIMSLPQQYKTQVAELGDNFSGGERQRLGLARAFLHKSDFLLLDEPTSNLDSYNEEKIMDSVKKESEGKTVVIVSHRDSTFVHADKIFRVSLLTNKNSEASSKKKYRK